MFILNRLLGRVACFFRVCCVILLRGIYLYVFGIWTRQSANFAEFCSFPVGFLRLTLIHVTKKD